jgi:uncharacterized membrane protein
MAITYEQLAYLHLSIIIPAFLIGTFLLLRRKGTRLHKVFGRIYLLFMIATGIITLFIQAHVGPRLLNHFGFIHIFSLVALYCAPAAFLAVRRGNLRAHRGNMLGLYIGGLLIAGAFAFSPGRMLNTWIQGTTMHSREIATETVELRH